MYNLWRKCGSVKGTGRMNLVVQGSSPLLYYSLILFLVAPSSTPRLHFVFSHE